MDESIKDISLFLIISFTELISTCISDKINIFVCIAIRLVIGSSINIIELSVIISSTLESTFLNVTIGILVPTIIFFLIFSIYLILLIKHQTRKMNNKVNLILSIIFKIINIIVAVIIIISAYVNKIDRSFISRLFLAYGVCDLALCFLSLLIYGLKTFCLRLFCKNNEHEDENDPELNDVLKETKSNVFFSFFCCIHLFICSIPAYVYAKKSIDSKEYLKSAKRLNKIFELFFISSNISLIFGASIFLCLTLFRFPSNCVELNQYVNNIFGSQVSGDIYLFQDSTNSTKVYCEKNSVLIMAKNNFNNFNYITGLYENYFNVNFSLYQNGFDHNPFSKNLHNYWLGLKNLHQLLEQKDSHLKIYLSNDNSSYYPVIIEFSYFRIKNESQSYELVLGNMSSNMMNQSDFGIIHNGIKFSAMDLDQDNEANINCASKYGGGWWFNDCFTFCPTCSNVTFNSSGLLYNYKYIKMLVE